MLEMKVIEAVETKRSAPTVSARRKYGSIIFYVAYLSLNVVTERDSYLIRIMDECTDLLGDTLIFSSFGRQPRGLASREKALIMENLLSPHTT